MVKIIVLSGKSYIFTKNNGKVSVILKQVCIIIDGMVIKSIV